MDGIEYDAPSPAATETAQAIIDPIASREGATKHNLSKTPKSHEITCRTIKRPAFSYACLQLISEPPRNATLDELTVRSYLTSALTQFLGLTGSAISVDILKVEPQECWIRVPREDLSAVTAAVGGWVGRSERGAEVGWTIRASGNWLGSLLGEKSMEKVWKSRLPRNE